MLGYCARDRASLAEVMGERGLRDFTKLSAFHGDGWGIAAYDDRHGHVEKSPRRAADDPAYRELAHRRLGDLGLVHLRRATPGLPVGARNSHPFRHDGIMMAHNGAIHPQDRLGGLLTPAWQRRLTGTTDSERYFLHVMSRLEAPGDVIAALDDTVAHIDGTFSANSLNAIFLTPDALYAICWYDPERIPPGAAGQQGYSGPPERYFDLAYSETDSAVVVASTGWPQDGWAWLPNRHVLVIDRETLRTKVEPLRLRGATSRPLPASPACRCRGSGISAPARPPREGITSWAPGSAGLRHPPGAARRRERESSARAAGARRLRPRPRSRWRSPARRRTQWSPVRRSEAECRSCEPLPPRCLHRLHPQCGAQSERCQHY
jgi:predicted glutamine amidotransferase